MKKHLLRIVLNLFTASSAAYWFLERNADMTPDPKEKIIYMLLSLIGMPIIFYILEEYGVQFIKKMPLWLVDLSAVILVVLNLIVIGFQIGEKL